jgi:hypothetical protein
MYRKRPIEETLHEGTPHLPDGTILANSLITKPMKANLRTAPLIPRHDENLVLTVTLYRNRVLQCLYSCSVPLPPPDLV